MQRDFKEAIARYISDHDPEKEVVIRITPNRDWSKGEIHYNWNNIAKEHDCGLCDDASQTGAEELVPGVPPGTTYEGARLPSQ